MLGLCFLARKIRHVVEPVVSRPPAVPALRTPYFATLAALRPNGLDPNRAPTRSGQLIKRTPAENDAKLWLEQQHGRVELASTIIGKFQQTGKIGNLKPDLRTGRTVREGAVAATHGQVLQDTFAAMQIEYTDPPASTHGMRSLTTALVSQMTGIYTVNDLPQHLQHDNLAEGIHAEDVGRILADFKACCQEYAKAGDADPYELNDEPMLDIAKIRANLRVGHASHEDVAVGEKDEKMALLVVLARRYLNKEKGMALPHFNLTIAREVEGDICAGALTGDQDPEALPQRPTLLVFRKDEHNFAPLRSAPPKTVPLLQAAHRDSGKTFLRYKISQLANLKNRPRARARKMSDDALEIAAKAAGDLKLLDQPLSKEQNEHWKEWQKRTNPNYAYRKYFLGLKRCGREAVVYDEPTSAAMEWHVRQTKEKPVPIPAPTIANAAEIKTLKELLTSLERQLSRAGLDESGECRKAKDVLDAAVRMGNIKAIEGLGDAWSRIAERLSPAAAPGLVEKLAKLQCQLKAMIQKYSAGDVSQKRAHDRRILEQCGVSAERITNFENAQNEIATLGQTDHLRQELTALFAPPDSSPSHARLALEKVGEYLKPSSTEFDDDLAAARCNWQVWENHPGGADAHERAMQYRLELCDALLRGNYPDMPAECPDTAGDAEKESVRLRRAVIRALQTAFMSRPKEERGGYICQVRSRTEEALRELAESRVKLQNLQLAEARINRLRAIATLKTNVNLVYDYINDPEKVTLHQARDATALRAATDAALSEPFLEIREFYVGARVR